MNNELCIERIEYLEGGLKLIEKNLKKLRKDFLQLKITPNKIREYIKTKKDHKMIKNNIQYFKWLMTQ